ncbi:MAG: OmpH family outer membrane protein [Bacteroidetes bacterium]|jgi:outer membrane protein|nr:OmpH family outer membrane protein [Bacteroidota bacterium]
MKKLHIVLFSVLFLAIALLYVLFFTGKDGARDDTPGSALVHSDAQGIAFVNIDSVIYNFEMFHDRSDELMAKQQKAEAELTNKGTQYERSARDYQDKVNKGLVTRATAAELEQSLYQQQQELVALRDNLQSGLIEEEQVMNRQIVEYITSYLEDKQADYNFQYILGKSFGSVVLYGDSALDITDRLVEELNSKYLAEKK